MAASIKSTADREIVFQRIVKAPRELVFDAFTDRDHIGHWWGPHGFTTTTETMDVKPGGTWRFVMHGPDGRDYKNLITYREVTRPERLVYDHGEPEGVDPFDVTVTFETVREGTRVTLTMICSSAEAKAELVKFGAAEGGHQTLHRLEMHTERMRARAAQKPYAITRTFAAPRDLVWKAWTEPKRLAEWWGPKGCKIEIGSFDLRPGGIFHYAMTYSTGSRMWGRFLYRDVRAPDRLVWFNSFSNELGGITRAPFNADWPLEMENITTFREKGGKTEVALESRPFGAGPAEIELFEGFFASLDQGFGGTMDQLAAYLASAQS
ncbi:MAG: SRPBCC family protein [Hyphomicrobium sp.]|nr:SRPBCC family protein [Hyphomicrobium sp.]